MDKYCKHTVLLTCLWVLVCGFFTSQITLRNFPNSGDEYSYLISAKLFSDGKLSVPSPHHRKFFDFNHIVNDGKFYGKYSPGWPFFLMFGELLGFPGLVNVVFAVLTLEGSMKSRNHPGGTAPSQVSAAIKLARKWLSQ